MHPVRQYGGIVRETFTHDKVINEKQAETFWNRSSMFSQFVSENKDLSIMYARPNIDHESYVEGNGSINSELCKEWVMVYRYYPQNKIKRNDALQASLDYYESTRAK